MNDVQEIRCPECGRPIPADSIISRWHKSGRAPQFEVPCLRLLGMDVAGKAQFCQGVATVRNYGNKTVAAFMEV